MLTLLEIFLKSSKGMFKQMFQSVGPIGTCAYNGPNGSHCGVGFLILPEHYSPEIEDSAPTGKAGDALRKSGVDVDDTKTMDVLLEIQSIHDNHLPDTWRNYMMILAQDNLSADDFQVYRKEIELINSEMIDDAMKGLQKYPD